MSEGWSCATRHPHAHARAPSPTTTCTHTHTQPFSPPAPLSPLSLTLSLQTTQESSAAVHRACLEQLETIKAQYFTFMAMFHPADGTAAAASLSRSPTAANGSSSLGGQLQSSLNEDISSLKRRLERLSESSSSSRSFGGEGGYGSSSSVGGGGRGSSQRN